MEGLYYISSKQNERGATQAQPTEPLVYLPVATNDVYEVLYKDSTFHLPSMGASHQVSVHLAKQF
jgi:hypothetical protein